MPIDYRFKTQRTTILVNPEKDLEYIIVFTSSHVSLRPIINLLLICNYFLAKNVSQIKNIHAYYVITSDIEVHLALKK